MFTLTGNDYINNKTLTTAGISTIPIYFEDDIAKLKRKVEALELELRIAKLELEIAKINKDKELITPVVPIWVDPIYPIYPSWPPAPVWPNYDWRGPIITCDGISTMLLTSVV